MDSISRAGCPTISNILSYDQALKGSKHPEKFGTGIPDGIIASEAGNNGTGGGELIPTMALGIPGSAVSAIMMGALILHGIQPGPMLIIEFPDLVYGVFVAFFLAHFFMLGIQLYGIRLFVRLTRVPLYVLVPAILVFCSVGSFSIHNRFFDIWVLLIFGLLGYLMKKYDFSLPPHDPRRYSRPDSREQFSKGAYDEQRLHPFLYEVDLPLLPDPLLPFPALSLLSEIQGEKENFKSSKGMTSPVPVCGYRA